MTESYVDVPGLVLTEPEPGIFELLIDRAERRNALTEEMMRGLPTVVEAVNSRPDAAALVVRGAGGAFCAGADLGVVNERRRTDSRWRWPELMGREAELLDSCEIATIAGPASSIRCGVPATTCASSTRATAMP